MTSRKIGLSCTCRLLIWSGLLSYIKFINRLSVLAILIKSQVLFFWVGLQLVFGIGKMCLNHRLNIVLVHSLRGPLCFAFPKVLQLKISQQIKQDRQTFNKHQFLHNNSLSSIIYCQQQYAIQCDTLFRTLCLGTLDIVHNNMVCSAAHCSGLSATLCPTIWSR